jgi:hypothetical protein
MPIDDTIPVVGQPAPKVATRENFKAIKAKINTLPEAYAGHAGKVLAVRPDGLGPDVPIGPVGFASQPVTGYKANGPPAITGSISLRDTEHTGQVIRCTNTSDIMITLDKTLVGPGFICRLWRRGSGEVTVLFGAGLFNRNASGHSAVALNRMAEIYVDITGSGDVSFDGGTK